MRRRWVSASACSDGRCWCEVARSARRPAETSSASAPSSAIATVDTPCAKRSDAPFCESAGMPSPTTPQGPVRPPCPLDQRSIRRHQGRRRRSATCARSTLLHLAFTRGDSGDSNSKSGGDRSQRKCRGVWGLNDSVFGLAADDAPRRPDENPNW